MSSARTSQFRTRTSKPAQSSASRRLSLLGYRVTQVCVNSSFVEILLGETQGSIAISISSPFSLRHSSRTQSIDLAETKSLAPVLLLLNKEAKYLEVFRDGSLKLAMADGRTLTVSKAGTAETWFASGTEHLQELQPAKE